MKISSRLRLSSGSMLAATLAIAVVAGVVTFSTKGTVSSTQEYFEADGILEQISSEARAYKTTAEGITATGAVSEDEQKKLDEGKPKLKALAARLGGADAEVVGKAIDEYTDATSAVVQEAVAAAAAGSTKPARVAPRTPPPAPKPVPAKLPKKAVKGAKAAPPPPAADEAPAPEPEVAVVDEPERSAGVAPDMEREFDRRLEDALGALNEKLTSLTHAKQTAVQAALGAAQGRATTLVVILAVLVLGTGAFVVFIFRGFQSELLRPMELLAQGARRVSTERDLTVSVPVSGDEEIQDLGRAFGEMMETLRGITIEMRGATDRLLASASELGGITRAQGESIARQASALEEARRTSIALRESSRDTVSQAEGVLRVAQKAEELGRSGETAMTENLSSAEVIQDQTRQVVDRIARLATSAQRIAAITGTVKDLADQSNVVALNAAIEASRAGEAGVGFGVVAREIRSLADRSIRATIEVRTVLAEVLNGIKESAALVEGAHAGLEEGTQRTRRLGDSVAGLTGIVRENLGAVREISGAVANQGTGIGQISNAVEDLSLMMEDTLKTVHTTGEAASVLREVSEQVSSSVKVFRI